MSKRMALPSIFPEAVRVRIAPSPTGSLHIGTARTALFNFLFARKYHGSFILRVEDTDLDRSDPMYEKDIVDMLRWLGIVWDEGPDIGGPFGPYRQSERLHTYRPYIERLLEEDKAYYCFCTKEELERARAESRESGQAPRYSGKCASLAKAETAKFMSEGRSSIIRFRMPARTLVFHDLIRGDIEYDLGLFGDISIAKDTATPLYNFAAVIDDALMQITHVIRGEDHIPNTPKQIALAEALELPVPQYAHLPLILGPDRTKLSKRHGATAVREFRDMGYLPEAMVNFMALLGWNPGTNQETFSMDELVEAFSLERVQRGGAVFNWQKLDWFNQYWQSHQEARWLTPPEVNPLLDALEWALTDLGIPPEKRERPYLAAALPLIGQRLEGPRFLSERLAEFMFFFREPEYAPELLAWKNMSRDEVKASLTYAKGVLEKIPEGEWTQENLEHILMQEAKEWGSGDRGKLLWPLRVALSGQKASPGPHEIAAVLGKYPTRERINNAMKMC